MLIMIMALYIHIRYVVSFLIFSFFRGESKGAGRDYSLSLEF